MAARCAVFLAAAGILLSRAAGAARSLAGDSLFDDSTRSPFASLFTEEYNTKGHGGAKYAIMEGHGMKEGCCTMPEGKDPHRLPRAWMDDDNKQGWRPPNGMASKGRGGGRDANWPPRYSSVSTFWTIHHHKGRQSKACSPVKMHGSSPSGRPTGSPEGPLRSSGEVLGNRPRSRHITDAEIALFCGRIAVRKDGGNDDTDYDDYDGTDYDGTDYDGTDYDGIDYDGIDYDGTGEQHW